MCEQAPSGRRTSPEQVHKVDLDRVQLPESVNHRDGCSSWYQRAWEQSNIERGRTRHWPQPHQDVVTSECSQRYTENLHEYCSQVRNKHAPGHIQTESQFNKRALPKTARKMERCQTRGFVHNVPASGVTTTPTVQTQGQERNIYTVRQLQQKGQFGKSIETPPPGAPRRYSKTGLVKLDAYLAEMRTSSVASTSPRPDHKAQLQRPRDQTVKCDFNNSDSAGQGTDEDTGRWRGGFEAIVPKRRRLIKGETPLARQRERRRE